MDNELIKTININKEKILREINNSDFIFPQEKYNFITIKELEKDRKGEYFITVKYYREEKFIYISLTNLIKDDITFSTYIYRCKLDTTRFNINKFKGKEIELNKEDLTIMEFYN